MKPIKFVLNKSTRRILAGALLACGVLTCSAAQTNAPPNIILILCDDLGYGDVGVFYQNQRAALHDRSVPYFSTPNIDTLAQQGVMLTQHYSGAPVCAPSRASLLSGLTQGNCNVRDNQFDKALADSHTLGTVLKKAGYATAAFGKWGLQGGDWKNKDDDKPNINESAEQKAARYQSWEAFPTLRGFDFFYGYVRHIDGHFHYPKENQREVWENDRVVTADLDKCYTDDLWTARAKKWITEQTKAHPNQPFFAYLAYDTPHAVLQNPPCAYPQGGGLTGGVQWLGEPHHMLNTAQGTMDGYMFPDYEKGTWDDDHNPATPEAPWPDVQKRYANDVRRIDFCVGDVMRLLKDLKIDNNTLVIFTSDNGPSVESYLAKEPFTPTFFRGYGPFDGIKRDTWEGGMREPTIASWPGVIPAGKMINQPCGQWDWLNTFAEIAGLPMLAASDGVSLLPSLTGRGKQQPGTIYIEYFVGGLTPDFADFSPAHRGRKRGQMQNIYLNGYMGVRYDVKSADDDFEIYNVTKDPQQTLNLAKTPELASLQAAMKARVLQLRKSNASAPRPYDNAMVPPATSDPVGQPGVSWAWFDGDWPWMPDFRTLTPARSGYSPTIALPSQSDVRPFGVSFAGYFHIPADGEYTFSVDAGGPAMLFVHDIRVIDESPNVPEGPLQGGVRLKAGWHPLRLYYRQPSGKPRLEFQVKASDGMLLPLNVSTFCRFESQK